MAGHRLTRAAALAVVIAAPIGAGAAVADGAGSLKGTPVAVRVARHVLAHVRQVAAMRWSQGGDQWECPSPDGPILGPAVTPPARGCLRVTMTYDEDLHSGAIARSLSTMSVGGRVLQTELVSGAGDWVRSRRARCWDAATPGGPPSSIPAISYADERLSITARTADVITLRGVGQGFRETDAIDAHTFAVREVDERVPGVGGTAKLVAHFAELTRPVALPRTPRRVCPDIVPFPPHPAR